MAAMKSKYSFHLELLERLSEEVTTEKLAAVWLLEGEFIGGHGSAIGRILKRVLKCERDDSGIREDGRQLEENKSILLRAELPSAKTRP